MTKGVFFVLFILLGVNLMIITTLKRTSKGHLGQPNFQKDTKRTLKGQLKNLHRPMNTGIRTKRTKRTWVG